MVPLISVRDREWRGVRRHLGAALMVAVMSILPAEAADVAPPGQKVLLVVAHPDDEFAFAATTYRLARELGATVDQVVITNGESGYHYSGLAELVYGVRLTDRASARARLPEIRRQEALAAGRILGIRRHYFLGQRDDGVSRDVDDTLQRLWDSAGVLRSLEGLMRRERYDFVFTTLPTAQTHAHHRAAAVLTLQAVCRLPEAARPVVLAADPDDEDPAAFTGLPSYRVTQPIDTRPVFTFDRRRRFGFHDAFSYQIVVNWVIAEYKSQGLFQNDYNRRDSEQFWAFAASGPEAAGRCDVLASSLNNPASVLAIR